MGLRPRKRPQSSPLLRRQPYLHAPPRPDPDRLRRLAGPQAVPGGIALGPLAPPRRPRPRARGRPARARYNLRPDRRVHDGRGRRRPHNRKPRAARGCGTYALGHSLFGGRALRRLAGGEPPEILGGWMLVVAAVGLVVNATGAAILSRSGGESLNLQGALRHVVADILGSLGALVGALMILAPGWDYADPLLSVLIG